MEKTSKFGRLGAAIAAAALASTMMAGTAFAVEAPSVEDGGTIATTNSEAKEAQGQTGIYLQIVNDSVISLNVPTKIYLAADQVEEGEVSDFKVPTNARIENLGKAVKVAGWDVAATNGIKQSDFAGNETSDKFWLQATVDQLNYEDIAVSGEPALPDAWKMAKGGSTNGVSYLNLGLKGQIYSPSAGKYANAPVIDTVTWKVVDTTPAAPANPDESDSSDSSGETTQGQGD